GDALRQTSCAAGVNKCKDRVRIVNRFRKWVVAKLKSLFVDDSFQRQLYSRGRQRRMSNQAPRTGVEEHMVHLLFRQPGVQGHNDQTQPGTRINQFDVFSFIRQQQSQTVACFETLFGERRGNLSDTFVKLPKTEAVSV